jgi:hypothetical protein
MLTEVYRNGRMAYANGKNGNGTNGTNGNGNGKH